MVLDSIYAKHKGVIASWMLESIGKLKSQVQELTHRAETMIPDALKELNKRLKVHSI
jgi:hypothetical protein